MSAYVFTPEAEEDLFEVWLHTAQDSPESVDRVESELHNFCAFLASRPYAGHNRPDVTTLAVRFWTVPRFVRYIIVYDPVSDPLADSGAFSMEPGTLPPNCARTGSPQQPFEKLFYHLLHFRVSVTNALCELPRTMQGFDAPRRVVPGLVRTRKLSLAAAACPACPGLLWSVPGMVLHA
jgi:plasmid stabilization system protein ParE